MSFLFERLALAAFLLTATVAFTGGGAEAQTDGKDGRVADPAGQTPAAASPPASGAETTPAQPQRPWLLTCTNEATDGELACTMTQTVLASETRQRVISATIFREPTSKVLRLQLGLPHGLDLPAGLGLSIDAEAPLAVPIKTADQNGSYALVDIDDGLLARMKAGQILNVAITSADGQPVTLQLSLAGFSASVDRLWAISKRAANSEIKGRRRWAFGTWWSACRGRSAGSGRPRCISRRC